MPRWSSTSTTARCSGGWRAKGDGETRFRASERVTAAYARLLRFADLVVGTEEELAIAGGHEEMERAVEPGARRSPRATIVIKRGPPGATVLAPGAAPLDVPGRPVEVLNVLGAGDAFLAGFLRGWLRGESLDTCGRWGNAGGALVVSRHGCAPAMATFEELSWFLAAAGRAGGRAQPRAREAASRGRPASERRELLVLAFDHRTCFENEADAAGVAARRDRRLQAPASSTGFLAARQREPDAGLALLVDPIYGAVDPARERGRAVRRRRADRTRPARCRCAWIAPGPLYSADPRAAARRAS